MQDLRTIYSSKLKDIISNLNIYKYQEDKTNFLNEIHKLHHFSEEFFLDMEMQYIQNINEIEQIKQQFNSYFQIFANNKNINQNPNYENIEKLIAFFEKWLLSNK